MKKKFLGLEEGSFAEGLAKFNARGGYVSPARLNKRMKEILLEMIADSKKNTCITFEHKDARYNRFMLAMQWLTNEITGKHFPKIKISKEIAYTVHFWCSDNENYHLSGEPDFDKAMQWITNKWNKYYPQSSLMKWEEEK